MARFSKWITLGALAAPLAFAVPGCSLTKFDEKACDSTSQCRQRFGFGAVCASDGFCDPPKVLPRCSTTYPDDLFTRPLKYRNAVVLGTMFDPTEDKQLGRQQAARLAALQINDGEGFPNGPAALVMCSIEHNHGGDDLDAAAAIDLISGFLTRTLGVHAIIGPSSSADTKRVFEVTQTEAPLIISPSATSPELTELEPTPTDQSPGRLWRTASPDTVQGPVIASDMTDRGVSQVAVVYQEGAYGSGLLQVFKESFAGAVEEFPFKNAGTRAEAIQKAKTATKDEVLFISSVTADSVAFLVAAAAPTGGLAQVGLFLTDGAATQALLDPNAKPAFSRVRGTRPKPLDPADFNYGTFLNGFQGEYGTNPQALSFTAHAYDAAFLAFAGSAWALAQESELSGVGIARGLRRVSQGAATNITVSAWQSVVTAFAKGDSIDLSGASGTLDYDPATEELSDPVEIWVISNDANRKIVPAN